MISQYPQYQRQYAEQPKKNYKLYILITVLIISTAVSIYLIFFTEKTAICGDEICGRSENCFDCPKDCKCKLGSYCDSTRKDCNAPKCGNKVCEPFESMENCCDDCSCTSKYETCNKTTHICEMPVAQISDERAKELATQYFLNQNKTVEEFGIITSTVYNDKPAKSVGIRLKDEIGVRIIIVTEDGQVFERIVY